MRVVCPSCDVIPAADAHAGAPCAGCGTRLVAVKAKEPAIGDVIDGRFEISERLGSGAMGVVFRATQLSIGRDVALKILATLESEPMIRRFFREAQIASALSHPNTVQIIEFGQSADGHVYLAMELVRGHTLLAEIEKAGALPSRRITRIGVQLCDAIETAHRQQIVHRDLKLENVMLAVNGSDHIKVLDFGIARIMGDVNTQVTATGLAAGTPHYMAPEVITRAADPAPPQDMYALGVILAELSLGETLWANATSLPMLLIEKTRNTVVERVPPRLRTLVKRLLDAEPDARPSPAETRTQLLAMERTATDPAGAAQTAMIAPLEPPTPIEPPTPLEPPTLEPLSLDLVGLDEREGAPATSSTTSTKRGRGALPASVFEPPMVDADAKLDIVEPGASLDLDKPSAPSGPNRPDRGTSEAPKLELERGWQRDRAKRPERSLEAERVAREQRLSPRGGSGRAIIVVLALLAVGGAGAYYYYVSTRPRPNAKTPPVTAPSKPATKDHAPRPHVVDHTPTMPPMAPPADEGGAPPADDKHGVSIRIVGVAGTPITIDGSPAGKLPVRLTRSASKKPVLVEAPGIVRSIVPDHSQTIDLTKPED